MNVNKKDEFFCCGALNYQIKDEYCPVEYSSKWREYSIRDFNSTSRSLMMFCPNCGIRLPSSLRDEWFDILEQEYELEDPMDDNKTKVPKEFWSDEWWKKRKLKNNINKKIDLVSLNRPERCLF
jgi:hypothetical protein